MKKHVFSWQMACILILALVLIGLGMVWSMDAFSHFDFLAASHEDLLHSLRATAVSIMICGSMVVVGIGILVILLLHTLRRTARMEKEAQALRRKNEAMEALNRQTQELAHHQRLETIGTMTASIAHEFNNLLTPIMGYSLMVMEKLPPEEEALYDGMLEIYNASRQAKNIISRLNDLARKNTASAFHSVSVDDVVRKTLDVANPAKPSEVDIRLDLNCWDQRLHANEIQLNQMLLNLILNGFHAMEETGGTLTISTGFDEANIHIRVADTGRGIPEEIRSRIFEPFFTTKETGKGTGLGLAIVAQVAENHRGRIQVESREGSGTAFTVILPRSPEIPNSD